MIDTNIHVCPDLNEGINVAQVLDDKFEGVHPTVIILEELSYSQHKWVRDAAAKGGGIHKLMPAISKDAVCSLDAASQVINQYCRHPLFSCKLGK